MNTENLIFEGRPSQWTNTGYFILSAILSIIGIGIIMFIARFLSTKFTNYKITDERLFIKTGVFSRKTDEMELYRVKDYRHAEPFFLRMVGKSSIALVTSDRTSKVTWLEGIPNGEKLINDIRYAVENRRDTKGVRELDMQDV